MKPSAPPELAPSTTRLGRYQLLSMLGRGGTRARGHARWGAEAKAKLLDNGGVVE
jgi:hypothetical protein